MAEKIDTEEIENENEQEITFTRENGKLVSNEILFSFSKPINVEFVEDGEDDGGKFSIRKFELIDNDVYNSVFWGVDDVVYQYDKFKARDYTVSHGLDHSWNTMDQLGPVLDMKLIYNDDKTSVKAIITSKHYKRTNVQEQAQILFEQEQLNFISGGWAARITYNEDEGRFEVVKPVLREVSSTPVPAKTDARRLEQALGQLNLSAISPKEENNMPEKPNEDPIEGTDVENQVTPPAPTPVPAPEPAPVSRQEFDALKEDLAANKKMQNEAKRVDLIKDGVELGLDEKRFEGLSNKELEATIQLTKEAVAIALKDKTPEHALGGPVGGMPPGMMQGYDLSKYAGLEEGSEELAQKILETEMPWLMKG